LSQAYLRFCGVQFKTTASNNHASPTGVLPFLSPASDSPPSPIPANKILKWVSSRTGTSESVSEMRYEAYASLVDYRIRSAWLFTLYLDDRNSEAVAKHLYIYPTSSNPLVQTTLFQQLKNAAQDELLKSTRYVREDEVYAEAEKAFEALSTLLGDDTHFFCMERPSLFDASVFAYTHLLLDESLNWQNKRLTGCLTNMKNLVQHRQRLLTRYFDG
jgi:metaxin